MNLDNAGTRGPSIRGVIPYVLATARIRSDPADRSDEGIVQWARPLVGAVAEHVFAPRHMTGEDLQQEIWVGVVEAVKTYDPARGPLRHWVARRALQKAYDAVRWSSRHQDDLTATEITEVADLLEDLGGEPETVLERRANRRLARHIARMARTASELAQRVLRELLAGIIDGLEPEQRLVAAGISTQAIDRARTELRAIAERAMVETIAENSFAMAARTRRP